MSLIEGLAVNASYSILSRILSNNNNLIDRVYKILANTEQEFFIKFNRFGNPYESFLARNENHKLLLNVIFFREKKLNIIDFNPLNYNDKEPASEKEIEYLISIFTKNLHQDFELSNLLQTKKSFELIDDIGKKLDKLIPNIDIESIYPFRMIADTRLPKEINVEFENFVFISKEKSIIDSIKNKFNNSEDRFVYIKSGPGLGKTILSLKTGLEFYEENYLILFYSLGLKETNVIEKLIEINKKEENDIICILTNCHLEFQLLKKIHLYSNEYPKIKFICEYRSVEKNDAIPFELYSLVNWDNVYKLDFEEIEFINKYRCIIEQYNSKLVLSNNLVKKIIKLTGWNFTILNQLLRHSEAEFNQLLELSNIQFLSIIYKFFPKANNDLRLIATINQFEISVNCNEYVEKDWFQDFQKRNLIIPEQSNFFQLYHSDFAKILIKSYYSINEFDHKNRDNYELSGFKEFILKTNKNYTRLFDVFERLYANKANSILTNLFSDKEIQSFIIEFYKDSSNFEFTNISVAYSKLFLMINKLSKSEIFNEYLSFLILDNNEFINLFTSNSQAILSLAEISILLKDCSKQHKDPFKNIAIRIFKSNCDKISFYDLCNTLFVLQKYNSFLYPCYIDLAGRKLLSEKALEESIVPLSKGLLILSKIKSPLFAKEIFNKIDNELFNINTQKDCLKTSLESLNILKKIDYTKTYDNFNIKNLNIEFSNYNLSNIVDIMIEIMKFSSSHEVRDYFSRKLTFELLSDKIKNEELPIIANQLIRLYKFCIAIKDTIVKIIQSISIEDFSIKSKYLTISEIEIIINQFSKIENEPYTHTKKLLRNMNDEWFILKLHSSSISNILNSMALLMKIEPDFIKNKYSNLETSISERIDELSFEEHIKILPYLYKFSSKRAFEILIYLINDSSKLKNWYQSLNYQAISKNLRFFQKIENGSNTNLNENIVYNFYCSYDDDFYSAKILDYEFGLLCNFSLIISRINASYKKSILRVFSKISNSQLDDKINSSSFLKVINGLVNLHQIDKNITNNVFSYSYNSLITIANNASILDFTIGLNTLKNRIPEYSYKIYTDNRIKVEHLAIQCNNSDLIEIKKYVYFLKNINLNKTVKFIECLDNDNIVFKFTNDRSFDKASNLFRDIHLINKSKIEKVLEMMDKDKLFEMCLESRFKVVIQGLSKITEINSSIAKTIFQKYKHQIDINSELLQISNFQNLSQKMREIVKIEDSKITTSDFINKIGESHFINLAKRSSNKQKDIGLKALMCVNSYFTKNLAKTIRFDF
jgi:hypothetical protein